MTILTISTRELLNQFAGVSRDTLDQLLVEMHQHHDSQTLRPDLSDDRLAGFADAVQFVQSCRVALGTLDEVLSDLHEE